MAIGSLPADKLMKEESEQRAEQRDVLSGTWLEALVPVASLKLTVVLLALSLLLVLFGTLAQDRAGIWRVVGQYFHSAFVRVPYQIFFPTAWFPDRQNVVGSFWFPGGATIGTLMMLNLLAAHLLRFKTQARDWRFGAGWALIALGVLTAVWVIVRGHNGNGLQAEPPMSWDTLWRVAVGIACLTTAGLAVAGQWFRTRNQNVESMVAWGLSGLLATGLFLMWFKGWRVDSAGMRILWQLLQGELAAVVLLGGCLLLFKKRAGIVLLHAGIGLLMFGQYYVARYDTEEQLSVAEGESSNYAQDIRCVELAVAERKGETDRVVAIPLNRAGHPTRYLEDRVIRDEQLPFDVKIVDYFEHSSLHAADGSLKNPASAGNGTRVVAVAEAPSAGASSDSKVDDASVYVQLVHRKSGENLGTFLLSQAFFRGEAGIIDLQERVTVDEREYELTLRFERNYKPYTIRLVDVKKEDYIGTSTPRNYASVIDLRDESRDVDRSKITISMNNPLRYANETFYQSGYNVFRGREYTTLQVVRNSGWMIPYVACMIVATGMLAHFGQVLTRFLGRVTATSAPQANARLAASVAVAAAAVSAAPSTAGRGAAGRAVSKGLDRKMAEKTPAAGPFIAPPHSDPPPGTPSRSLWMTLGLPVCVLAIVAAYVARISREPKYGPKEMNLTAFGRLPVADHGRVKPLDTLARNSLRIISNAETVKDAAGNRQPAIRWLLDVISEKKEADDYQVVRIDNPEVLSLLQLQPRPGFLRYSVNEIRPNIDKLEAELEQARKLKPQQRGVFEKKLAELEGRLQTYMMLVASFQALPFPKYPTREELERDPDKYEKEMRELLFLFRRVDEVDASMNRFSPPPPRAIPDRKGEQPWVTFASAVNHAMRDRIAREYGKADAAESHAEVEAFDAILAAYRKGDAHSFNREVELYAANLARDPPAESPRRGTAYEAFVNAMAPFYHANVLYIVAFIVTLLGWLAAVFGKLRLFRDIAFWTMIGTFLLHTLAIWQRMEISGRPPVTNLYSSAVFIGWAIVGLALVMEAITKVGVGNGVGAIAGSATLFIGHFLSNDGDTVAVMQAVLDTQFWLATHVVVISLGYSATLAAGLLGMLYVAIWLLDAILAACGLNWTILGHTVRQSLADPLQTGSGRETTVGKALASMIYGIICFATLASFVGTVLGGLWADDSWGRFWGWDPKENGALIIVIWNAIVLHARWDGMVRERGVAILALGGNIVTAWSWFGVNELGIGLHAYGFTEGRLRYLAMFVISQLALIGLGGLLRIANALLTGLRSQAKPA
jgi:ABC-type transport system involved in cytochrome c biogenesis permease subunit